MTEQGKNIITKRTMLMGILMGVFAFSVMGKLFYTYFGEGRELRARAERLATRDMTLEAERGNIYSSDGKLLATSMPVYDIYMDPGAPSDENFNANIAALGTELSKMFPTRSASQWTAYLKSRRADGDRYVRLGDDLTFSQLQRVKSFPLFELGKYKGGLISEEQHYRKMPLGRIAERTIGYDGENNQVGVEGAFSTYLTGRDGHRLMQKISNGNWKPLDDENAIAPRDGQDVITTIDTRIQDVANRSLLNALSHYEADHGCAIVMEVATGKIIAIANLGRTANGNYYEQLNYAVGESTEPGSTFKLASLMVALEDGVIDTSDIVDTENGIYTIYNRKVKDSNVRWGRGGYGEISVAEAFRKSSNTGIVKAIYPAYKDRPQAFIDRLYQIGLHERTGIQIRGEALPKIPTPEDANWSGTSLPWIAFGYEVQMTPLQVLTFYNAIANNGRMVRPRIVSEIKESGITIHEFSTEIINPAVCSEPTLKKLQTLLSGVVAHGTARNIRSETFNMAGKTGTCQLNYWLADHNDYQASFAGYFPAENPQYSCIVVVNKPNPALGYYGSTVAAPVFRAIADEVYRSTPRRQELEELEEPVLTHTTGNESIETSLENGVIPDLRGRNGMEVISLLENMGYRVQIEGAGKVQRQWPSPGTQHSTQQTVVLKLG
ncbi:penicillin-binding protein [Phaeocystidibacter marisrubri]|uniref:Transpeptidase family protein n=2 Tax=Phaeocystidibacter marisrubri TaxID=1577780 RepID=A0A6L3ZGZ1_9FLAO|nr:transpeptidase family protein [Phaeocystidibacter marisrubri]GGH77933.1 penicillin-binding protein [Phaeocystidibacter marisrubri]